MRTLEETIFDAITAYVLKIAFAYFFRSNYFACLSVFIVIPNIFKTSAEGISKIVFFIVQTTTRRYDPFQLIAD